VIPEAERTDFNAKPQSIAKIAERKGPSVFMQISAIWCNSVQFTAISCGQEGRRHQGGPILSPPAGGGDLGCYLLQGNVCRGFMRFLGATKGATRVLPDASPEP
jgi:hypothetical protein